MARMVSVAILALVSASWFLQAAGINLCDECICKDLHPYLIDCSSLHLDNHFIADDFDETLARNNISKETPLDVRFDNNKISRIFKLPPLNIQSLSFANNLIDTIDPSAFEELPILESLDLSHNKLDSDKLQESSFYGKYNGSTTYFPLPIKFFTLSKNDIHSIHPNMFDHFDSLETLDISRNPLITMSGTSTQAISKLRNLRVLDLAFTGIRSIPEGMLHDLKYLESLNLAYNEFAEVPMELSYTHSLKTLVLDGNKFKTLNEESFQNLEDLVELDISEMPTLRAIEHNTFGPLKSLKRLKCSHNPQLSKVSDSAFQGMVNDTEHWPLTSITLSDNALTRLDKELANWRFVDHLDVQNNPFICDCKIKWMVTTLVPMITQENTNVNLDIRCAEPEDLRGNSLVSLSIESEMFDKCGPEGEGTLGTSAKRISYEITSISIVVLTLGIVLVVIGLSILGVIIVKRRAIARSLERYQPIRYEADVDYRDVTGASGTLKI